jgi:hypothetical protein
MTERQESIVAAYEATKPRLQGLSFEDFTDFLSGAEIEPVKVGGQIIGALVVIGSEIHACIKPEFKGLWMSRKTLAVLRRVIEKHGYATTSATTDEGRAFVQRLGFVQEGDMYVLRAHHGT